MNYNCGIIDDLLPLYADGACSEESKAAIEAHLASCEACRKKLERMQSDTVVSETIKSAGKITVTKYAKKVRKHRIKLAIGLVAISVIAACLLSLVFLTLKDMHNYANPIIYEVETGTYNLTSNDLEVAVADIDDYIFFTNNTKIEVPVDNDADFSGEVMLWNADDPNNPVTILYGKITPEKRAITFSHLSSAHRYMITCDGNENLVLTITDGRNVSFFGSMKNVLIHVWDLIMGF